MTIGCFSSKLVESEKDLLAELHELRQYVVGDDDAVRVIDQYIDNQRRIIDTMSEHMTEATWYSNTHDNDEENLK